MIKGPLVYAAVALAFILIAMSFLIAAFPDRIETLGIITAVVAVLVVIVLVGILIKTRRGSGERGRLRRPRGTRGPRHQSQILHAQPRDGRGAGRLLQHFRR